MIGAMVRDWFAGQLVVSFKLETDARFWRTRFTLH
jgi:hypothetical protein